MGAVTPSKPRLSLLGASLFAIGALPFLMWGLVVAAGFVWPQTIFGLLFDLFEPPDVDAPDNWAVAFTRIGWLFVVTGSIGVVFLIAGLWVSRPRPLWRW